MLSNQHFYHQLTRKYVILFGNIFNNIQLVRTDGSTGDELERMKVPIAYGPKEKYIMRLDGDPDLLKEVQVILPRMSFEITGIRYDATRKQNTMLRTATANTTNSYASQYMAVPYNLDFELSIYSRTIEDGNQIVEQILPYFTPAYTQTAILIADLGFQKDISVELMAVNAQTEYGGDHDSVRYVRWTLNFTMRGYYFGPISTSKIIRKVITNIYNDPSLRTGYIVRINTGSGNNGHFLLDDLVFQGNNYTSATAYGFVSDWSNTRSKLVIGGAQGNFKVGQKVKALSTNASYTIVSFEASPLKLAKIEIVPDPLDADPEDDYGYTTTITENIYGNLVF